MFWRYIAKPYLINQTKFDLRLYVLITSINPLRIYLYDDGLVRFASKPYSSSTSTAADVFTHLTNYSINKQSATYLSNEDSRIAQVGRKYRAQSSSISLGTQVDSSGSLEIFPTDWSWSFSHLREDQRSDYKNNNKWGETNDLNVWRKCSKYVS